VASYFIRQHDEMLALADSIIAASRSITPDGLKSLMELRLRFARCIGEHCRSEDDQVRAAIVDGRVNAKVAAEARAAVDRWRTDLALCNSNWPPSRLCGNPGGFNRDFAPLAEALRKHVRWEEEELLPSLA
jgi:hypothetical protein